MGIILWPLPRFHNREREYIGLTFIMNQWVCFVFFPLSPVIPIEICWGFNPEGLEWKEIISTWPYPKAIFHFGG